MAMPEGMPWSTDGHLLLVLFRDLTEAKITFLLFIQFQQFQLFTYGPTMDHLRHFVSEFCNVLFKMYPKYNIFLPKSKSTKKPQKLRIGVLEILEICEILVLSYPCLVLSETITFFLCFLKKLCHVSCVIVCN